MKRRSFLAAALATIPAAFVWMFWHWCMQRAYLIGQAFRFHLFRYALVESRCGRYRERYIVPWRYRHQLVADLSVHGPRAGRKSFTITPCYHA